MHTDHSSIHFLMNKSFNDGRVIQWSYLLQYFDVTILDKHGKDNVVVDFLSRLTIGDDCVPMEDYFPDEYLFSISTHSPWYADIANYLATGNFPQYLSRRERKNFIQQSTTY